jgi:hypothetical protein
MSLEEEVRRLGDILTAGLRPTRSQDNLLIELAENAREIRTLLKRILAPPEERILLTMKTTDDFKVAFKAEGFDADGISTGLIIGGTATVDNDAVATVAEDPTSPGSYVVQRKPASDDNTGIVTVTVTIEDTLTRKIASQQVEFDPGAESSIVLTPTLISTVTDTPVVSSDPVTPPTTVTTPVDVTPIDTAPVDTVAPPDLSNGPTPVEADPTAAPPDLSGDATPPTPSDSGTAVDDGTPTDTSTPTTFDPGTVITPGDTGNSDAPAGNPGDTPVPNDPTVGDQGSGTSPTQSTGAGPAPTDPGTNTSTVGAPTTVDPSAPLIPTEPAGTPDAPVVDATANDASTSG